MSSDVCSAHSFERVFKPHEGHRPKTDAPVPVIMTLCPYGKGVMYQDHYKAM